MAYNFGGYGGGYGGMFGFPMMQQFGGQRFGGKSMQAYGQPAMSGGSFQDPRMQQFGRQMAPSYQGGMPQGGQFAGMPSQQSMNSDAQMRANYMRGGGGGGMFAPPQMSGLNPNFAGRQMSTPNQMQTGGQFNPMMGSQTNPTMPMQNPAISDGNMETYTPQTPTTQPAAQPQQSFEQFAATLNGSGMTSGQINDAYQKSIQPPPSNFWQNVGPGGTQNPYPNAGAQPFPSNWGQQSFGFDPRSLAGQQVTGDKGWYYGRDAIGRQINNQGDAYATFRGAADGFNRSRPWNGGGM